jgi:hypothetical protein
VSELFCGELKPIEIPERIASGAKKFAAHVVVHADDVVALPVEMLDSFRADESAAAGDENGFGHE